jgi:small subunit ribosomal protein S6
MAKSMPVERPYESLFICPTDTPQKTIDAFTEKVKTTLAPTNGLVRSVQVWGRRRLTFPIKHHKDGLYVYVDFNGGSGSAEALKNLFRVTDFIMRHVIVERKEIPAPVERKPVSSEAPAAASSAAAAPISNDPQSKEHSPSAPHTKERPSATKEA